MGAINSCFKTPNQVGNELRMGNNTQTGSGNEMGVLGKVLCRKKEMGVLGKVLCKNEEVEEQCEEDEKNGKQIENVHKDLERDEKNSDDYKVAVVDKKETGYMNEEKIISLVTDLGDSPSSLKRRFTQIQALKSHDQINIMKKQQQNKSNVKILIAKFNELEQLKLIDMETQVKCGHQKRPIDVNKTKSEFVMMRGHVFGI